MPVHLTVKEAKQILKQTTNTKESTIMNNGKPNTSLAALNDMLFDQLERITNDDLDDETIEKEIKRTKMITAVSNQIVSNAELELRAIKVRDELMTGGAMPSVFGLPEYKE